MINYYKGLNKKNVLIVGAPQFFDTFKVSAQKYGWEANFFHETSASALKFPLHDLAIDEQYKPQCCERI